jgi:hypothetical protein
MTPLLGCFVDQTSLHEPKTVVNDPGYINSVSGDRAPLPHGRMSSAFRNKRLIRVVLIRTQIDCPDCDFLSSVLVIVLLGCLERERGGQHKLSPGFRNAEHRRDQPTVAILVILGMDIQLCDSHHC